MKRHLSIIILSLYSALLFPQEIMPYEKRIKNIEQYNSTPFSFTSDDNLKFYGTLLSPKNDFDKVIILIPGSGKDTRHSHHQLTKQLLDHNIAVLRYDERGAGKSEGTFSTALYTVDHMSNELYSAYKHLTSLPEMSLKKIGFLGHSLGGMTTMNLVKNNIKPDFLIQFATPVQKNGAFLFYQLKTGINTQNETLKFDNINKKEEIMNIFHSALAKSKENQTAKENFKMIKEVLKLAKSKGYKRKNYDRFHYANMPSERALIKKDFEENYKNIDIPLLYIIGSEDKFVDANAETNLLKSFDNSNISIKILDGLNHYLTKTKLELNSSMYEISPIASQTLLSWLKKIKP